MTKFIFGVYQSFGIVIPRSRSNSIKVWGEETSEKITKSQNFTMVNHTSKTKKSKALDTEHISIYDKISL